MLSYFKWLLTVLIVANIGLISIDLLGYQNLPAPYLKAFIFLSITLMALFVIEEKAYDLLLSLISFAILNNPFVALNAPLFAEQGIQILTIFFFVYSLYYVVLAKAFKRLALVAFRLDEYLKTLDHTLAGLTYHQVSLYVHKRFPSQSDVSAQAVSWHVSTLPEAQFRVEAADFLQYQRGRVCVSFKGKLRGLEVYLNFHFSETVRFAVKLNLAPKKLVTYQARNLRYILVNQYHYIDLS